MWLVKKEISIAFDQKKLIGSKLTAKIIDHLLLELLHFIVPPFTDSSG